MSGGARFWRAWAEMPLPRHAPTQKGAREVPPFHPFSLAAAMTSSSRMEPPGSITATTPASASTSNPSRNGKNASLAATAPLAASPACSTAMRAEFTRLGWPPPAPTLASSFAMRMAFTDFTAFHANTSSRICSGVGCTSPATVNVSGCSATESLVCASRPPSTLRYSTPSPAGFTPPVASRRQLGLLAYISQASPENSGATMASTNCLLSKIAPTSSPVTGRLNAMTPPYADTGSHSCARLYAAATSASTHTPHGVRCFTMTQAGSSYSRTAAQAASRSR